VHQARQKGYHCFIGFYFKTLVLRIAFSIVSPHPFSYLFPSSEYKKLVMATAAGFAIMGFIGFFVKLVHIPINNILVGA
jgi:uncharacterized membrane protein YagU involved in acid resistance